VREQNFRFRLLFRVRCTEPKPEDQRSEGIRIATDANHQMFIVFINLDQSRFKFIQFLMPKV
jgi:hypothetical protein